MMVFSKDFGSEDAISEAINCAGKMAEHDSWAYGPHFAVAAGKMVVGYVGTRLGHNCSVYGSCVTIASRCMKVKPPDYAESYIVVANNILGERKLTELIPPTIIEWKDGQKQEQPYAWKIVEPKIHKLEGIGNHEIGFIVRETMNLPSISPEDLSRETIGKLIEAERIRVWQDQKDLCPDGFISKPDKPNKGQPSDEDGISVQQT